MRAPAEVALRRQPQAFPVIQLFSTLAAAALMSPSPLLALTGVVTLLIGMNVLWRPGESSILLVLFAYQWMQVNVKTFYAMLHGIAVTDLGSFYGDVGMAILLGNGALVALALGMRWGAGPQHAVSRQAARAQVLSHSMGFWLVLYSIGWLASALAVSVAWLVPGLTQPMLALASVRWIGFFLLTYVSFSRSPQWQWWWVVFILEFVLAVGGFFSGFQTVIIYALVAISAAKSSLDLRRAAPLLVLVALLGVSAIVWTYVKREYRGFVSGGQQAQVVVVDRPERLAQLARLAADLRPADVPDTFESLVERVAYVDFFARVLKRVPAELPHAEGALWGDALLRIITPRLLFPDKAAVHDSVRTNYYTGLGVATHEQGTSISVGYVAESYIDFGSPLMFAPVLALGLLIGRFYRWAHHSSLTVGVWGMALASVALWPAMYFETSVTKMLPALALSMFMAWVLARYLLPAITHWLSGHLR